MKPFALCLLMIATSPVPAQSIKLAPPQVRYSGMFFTKSASVDLELDLEGASMYYSIDNHPFRKFRHTLRISRTSQLSVFAQHPEFANSDTLKLNFHRANYLPDRILWSASPHPTYPGKGAASLYDLLKGGANISDGCWVGFAGDTVMLEATFSRPRQFHEITISTMTDIGAWILPVRAVQVWVSYGYGVWTPCGSWEQTPGDIEPAGLRELCRTVALRGAVGNKLRIKLFPFGPLPSGHAGAGKPAWMFLDEVIFK